jgi:hypothetical protein
MDVALELQIDIDNGKRLSEKQIEKKLEQSELVKELISEFSDKPLALVWQLICISEIPFRKKLTRGNMLKKQSIPIFFSKL